MVWGKREKKFAQQYKKHVIPRLPEQILNAPDLRPGLELYWTAYSELSSCRPPGLGGLMQIPWTAIDRYAERHEFTFDQFDWLVTICREMDDAMAKQDSKENGGT